MGKAGVGQASGRAGERRQGAPPRLKGGGPLPPLKVRPQACSLMGAPGHTPPGPQPRVHMQRAPWRRRPFGPGVESGAVSELPAPQGGFRLALVGPEGESGDHKGGLCPSMVRMTSWVPQGGESG